MRYRIFEFHVHARVRMLARIIRNPMSNRLSENVFLRETPLFLIAQTSVEVFLPFRIPPEWEQPNLKRVVHELRDGSVQTLHELRKIITDAKDSFDVVMVVHQRRDPGIELKFPRVVLEAIPEDQFRLLRFKGFELVATARSLEVNLVADQPVFEAILIPMRINRVSASRNFPHRFRHD